MTFPLKGMKETACAKQEDSINLIIQNISVHQNGLGTNHIHTRNLVKTMNNKKFIICKWISDYVIQ